MAASAAGLMVLAMRLVLLSGALGFFAVAFGAFGAHALDGVLDAGTRALWDTASLYALAHAPAAFGAALASERSKWFARAAAAFLIGAFLFSGSLYALAFGAPKAAGFVTPVGGVSLLAGWAFVIAGGLALKKRPH